MTPEDARTKFSDILSEQEKTELDDYSFVYYCGENARNQSRRINVGFEQNGGYDDTEGYYHAVIGDHIAFRYEIKGSLGAGACGQVIKAHDRKHDLPVALKMVRNIPLFKDLAQQEIEIGKRLTRVDSTNNYCVVHMLNNFEFRNHPCLVFELLGLNLFDLMRSNQYRGLSEDFVRDFATELLHSLEIMTRNKIIHCDIKPQNVMIFGPDCKCNDLLSLKKFDEFVAATNANAQDGDIHSNNGHNSRAHFDPKCDCGQDKVKANFNSPTNAIENLIHMGGHHLKLIDFGCSVISGHNRYQYIQSRYYRAPEVILGSKYSCPVDIWSFACVVAELVLGTPLFPGKNEADQLALIMEYLNLPPDDVLQQSKRCKNFFTPEGYPIKSLGGTGHVPGTKTFEKTFGEKVSPDFIDFLSKCLTWRPADRISPTSALSHSWILDSSRQIRRKRSLSR